MTAGSPPITKPRMPSSRYAIPARWPDTCELAIVFLAGPVAETRLLGTMLWAHGNQSDFSGCQQLCYVLDRYRRHLAHKHGLVIPKEKPVDMANRLRRRTRNQLALRLPISADAPPAPAKTLRAYPGLASSAIGKIPRCPRSPSPAPIPTSAKRLRIGLHY